MRNALYYAIAILLCGVAAHAAEPTTAPTAATVKFNRDVRPILSDTCFKCHGFDKNHREAGLRLDTPDEAFKQREGVAGDPITPIVPGNLEKSDAWQRIAATDPDDLMPPADSHLALTDKQKETIKHWIEQGAKYEPFWAFVPIKNPPPPTVKNAAWVRNPIDNFILARLESEGLEPSPEADRATLLRRVTFDLIGLPPTPAETEAFLKDQSPDAYDRVVDRLLASPRYGERMTLDWLDCARYGDTHGYNNDTLRSMWPWRDWVIKAFNSNKPYNVFLTEQLAGDLLPHPTRDQIVATGFNRNHVMNSEGGIISEEYRIEYVLDRTATASNVFMGLTVQCARCHDHKFDPITQKDFYQLTAFFNQLDEVGQISVEHDPPPLEQVPSSAQEKQLNDVAAEIASLDKTRAARVTLADQTRATWEPALLKKLSRPAPTTQGLIVHLPLDESGAAITEVANTAPPSTQASTQASTQPITHASTQATSKPATLAATAPTSATAVAATSPATRLATRPAAQLTAHLTTRPAIRGKVATTQGAIDGAIELDGKSFVDLGKDLADFGRNDPFSFGAWIKPTSMEPGTIVARMDDVAANRGYDLIINKGKLEAHVISVWPSNALFATTKEPLTLNEWHHVFMTYDGSSKVAGIQIYVDGEPVALDRPTNTLSGDSKASNVSLQVGKRRTGVAFTGAIDDVRVYSRALKPDEARNVIGVNLVGKMIAIDPARRTPQQQNAIRDYYLKTADAEFQSNQTNLDAARKHQADINATVPTVMVMKDMNPPRKTFILKRGQYDAHGDEVQPNTPSFLPPIPNGAPHNRLGLAMWLTDPAHPLTSRVAVNRYWYQFFGTGLVKTMEDWGAQGEPPSHPQLIDWLAWRFMHPSTDSGQDAWNVKAIQRLIVTSATYRQAARYSPELIERDPENRLLARGPRARLAAEAIRDNALSLAGLLVDKLGGPSVMPYQPAGLWDDVVVGAPYPGTKYTQGHGDDLYRRSMYTFWKRTSPPPSLSAFDAPARETCVIRRAMTNTPLQALALMNDPTYIEASRKLAERIMHDGGASPPQRIAFLFHLATAHAPTDAELKVLCDTFTRRLAKFQAQPDTASKLLTVGESKSDAKLNQNELAAYTTVASMVLNLDEVITK